MRIQIIFPTFLFFIILCFILSFLIVTLQKQKNLMLLYEVTLGFVLVLLALLLVFKILVFKILLWVLLLIVSLITVDFSLKNKNKYLLVTSIIQIILLCGIVIFELRSKNKKVESTLKDTTSINKMPHDWVTTQHQRDEDQMIRLLPKDIYLQSIRSNFDPEYFTERDKKKMDLLQTLKTHQVKFLPEIISDQNGDQNIETATRNTETATRITETGTRNTNTGIRNTETGTRNTERLRKKIHKTYNEFINKIKKFY